MSERPRLYSAITCNFCHRNLIALSVKGVDVEAFEIDLVKRPDWYRAKASGGSVPLFEWGELQIHPSTVINEFIEERWPEPPMLSDDPVERAAARMWIEWWNEDCCPTYERRLMNVRPERDGALSEALEAALRECEERLRLRGYDEGYWHGERIGLVDATAAPMFVRFCGLRHFHDIDVPADLGRVRAWRDVLMDDPHVQATSPEEARLLDTYRGYRQVLSAAAQRGIEVKVARGD